MTLTDAKVITQHGPRDFDATFDGEYIGSFRSRWEAQRALDDYVLGLCEQGLVDTVLATVPDGTPTGDYDDVPAGDGEPV